MVRGLSKASEHLHDAGIHEVVAGSDDPFPSSLLTLSPLIYTHLSSEVLFIAGEDSASQVMLLLPTLSTHL